MVRKIREKNFRSRGMRMNVFMGLGITNMFDMQLSTSLIRSSRGYMSIALGTAPRKLLSSANGVGCIVGLSG